MLLKTLSRAFTTKRVLVAVANGCEEIETITPIDILRRAGAEVIIGAVGTNLKVTLSHGVKLEADVLIEKVKTERFDLMVIPGGQPGADNMRDCEALIQMLKMQNSLGKWYSAICASPAVVLQTHGLLEGKTATCYPSFESSLTNQSSLDLRVVQSFNCITSKAPGTAIEFSLRLVRVLYGEAKEDMIGKQILIKQEKS
jgi:4-methyl-5(b-hydroxyethyl)-thiazole monophosphate biosynthesis